MSLLDVGVAATRVHRRHGVPPPVVGGNLSSLPAAIVPVEPISARHTLNGNRLVVAMVWKLHTMFGILAESLIKQAHHA
ncbi:hypothetical protein KG088_17610 [Halomonas sp. TRM85114]|uniref:hypothetical protein n=1 Tax=Halomonas jincaotanensis TaxID=2810616 RepID=UPI001BD4A649|nr:hypothetical protein [Halomonas jincaotanensis]MBS9405427.1 hypothetical protein [Halomonas jincaotanensis]